MMGLSRLSLCLLVGAVVGFGVVTLFAPDPTSVLPLLVTGVVSAGLYVTGFGAQRE